MPDAVAALQRLAKHDLIQPEQAFNLYEFNPVSHAADQHLLSVAFDLVVLLSLPDDAALHGLETSQKDDAIRQSLQSRGLKYAVLCGPAQAQFKQLRHLMALLDPTDAAPPMALRDAAEHHKPSNPSATARPKAWVWMCDKCGDSDCEHTLLTALLKNKP